MKFKTSYLRYLWKERKSIILKQALNMVRLHRTPFQLLLENILQITENFGAGFTFPISASAALRNPDLLNLIVSFDQEIASHGFKHVNYNYLSVREQKEDIKLSLSKFDDLGVKINGFRAPYNTYTFETPFLLDKLGFFWDGGIGFHPDYCRRNDFFRFNLGTRKSKYICIPLSRWSDDRMIEVFGLNKKESTKILMGEMVKAANNKGIIMFDLHPLRIGQPQNISMLSDILNFGQELNGWFPVVNEAVEYWLKKKSWKNDSSFCCLLTGDIDNFTFSEYVARLF